MIITRFLLHREGDEEKKDALQATTELWPLPQGPETSGPALLTRDAITQKGPLHSLAQADL